MSTASPPPAWGHSNSFVTLSPADPIRTDEQARDRLQILDAVNRYSWSYDERQLDALAAAFTEDAVWEGSVAGTAAIDPLRGRDAIVDWLKGHMASQDDQRRHNTLNHVVLAQAADSASVITYLLLTSASSGQVRVVTSGFYHFDLVRSEVGGWLIRRLFGGFDCPF
jgi:ketosteroid isomerase-like protein